MVEYKDMEVKYIRSKGNPTDIMMKNCSEADYVKHTNRITERELWEIEKTRTENVKNNGVLDGVMGRDST